MQAPSLRLAARSSGMLIAGVLLALVAGCNGPQTAPTTPTVTPGETAVPIVSPTPTPARVVLVAPNAPRDAVGASILAATQATLQRLAAAAQIEFVSLAALPEDEAVGVALLVALPPDPGLRAWAESHPAVPTVSLGIPGAQAASNLWVIAPDGIRHDQLGFALGYLAAMVTPEYRVGATALDASATSIALARGFVAGGTYYCGLCRPIHPPYLQYPAYLAGGLSDLADGSVSTLLVNPPPQSFSELGLPANSETAFVGVGVPAEELSATWIASAEFDVAAALERVWTQVHGGQSGTAFPLGIRFHSVNESLVSEGRLRLTEGILADLSAGVIDTGVDPLTGELR